MLGERQKGEINENHCALGAKYHSYIKFKYNKVVNRKTEQKSLYIFKLELKAINLPRTIPFML